MNGSITLGTLSIIGTVIGEHYALQAVADPTAAPLALGPYIIPIVGVIAAYASFRTAFAEHRRRTEAELASMKADMDKKVAHDVLAAHLAAIHHDIGGLRAGQDGIIKTLQDMAGAIGRLQGAP